MKHLYWAVDCKTEGCDTQMFFEIPRTQRAYKDTRPDGYGA